MPDSLIKEIREAREFAQEGDRDNRAEAKTDLEFEAGEQWDDRVKRHRDQIGIEKHGFPLPSLTINTAQQFVAQVIGDRRANQTSIKVLPREDGDVKVAEVRSELIRGIELQSKADRVRSQAFGQQVSCGIGHTRIDLDYAYEDAFERDLFIRGVANPLSVLWDPLAADPTGRDAKFCIAEDYLPEKEYERRFKDAARVSAFDSDVTAEGWLAEGAVRVAEYWRIEERERTIALMADGTVQDVTEKREEDYKPFLFLDASGKPRLRKSGCKYAVMTLTNGQETLSDPFELKLHRVPIIRWMGREVWIGDRRVRFGLIRFLRDQQRLKNYLRSVAAEKLMTAPRHSYMASSRHIEGRTKDWPNTLVYNPDGGTPPQEATQNNLHALLEMSVMFSQDMKETTGIYEANLGQKSNETSGVAIRARQQEGDIAAIVYHDNGNAAMQEEGEVVNALIPVAYDTPRTIRVVGVDDAVRLLRVNEPGFQPTDLIEENIDIAKGRYDVAISTGPAYMTKRLEAATQLMELARANANIMIAAPDLVIQSLDIPKGDKIAERMKRSVPPQILGPDAEEDEMTPEQMQQKAQQQQMQQAVAELEMRKASAETEKVEAEARKAKAEADQAESGIKLAVEGYNAETSRLKAITAKDFPLPPEAVAILAPIVTQAVMQALQSPDVLPDDLSPGEAEAISLSAYDGALNKELNGEEGAPRAEEGTTQ